MSVYLDFLAVWLRLMTGNEGKKNEKKGNKNTPQVEMQKRREGDIVREQIETSNQGRREKQTLAGRRKTKTERTETTPNTFERHVYFHLFLQSTPPPI
jgi:hypothetical protein